MELLWAILIWCLIGLVAGGLARLLVPGRQPMGIAATILLGIAGSLVGGFLGWLFTGGGGSPLQMSGIILSIVGAVVLVLIYVGATSRRKPAS